MILQQFEIELWNTYFDSLLSCIRANSEKSVSLRWFDKICNPNIPMRPDAIISVVDQLQFGCTLGHGEVKISQPTCEKAAVCLDLIRIAHFNKDAIDNYLIESVFAFQIHGFAIGIY